MRQMFARLSPMMIGSRWIVPDFKNGERTNSVISNRLPLLPKMVD